MDRLDWSIVIRHVRRRPLALSLGESRPIDRLPDVFIECSATFVKRRHGITPRAFNNAGLPLHCGPNIPNAGNELIETLAEVGGATFAADAHTGGIFEIFRIEIILGDGAAPRVIAMKQRSIPKPIEEEI